MGEGIVRFRGAGVPIYPCALEHSGLIGAAELAWQPVLDDPALLRRDRLDA